MTALARYRKGGRRARTVRRVLALALLAGAGVAAASGGPTDTTGGTPVQVAARDLTAGATLTTDDVRSTMVRDPPDGALPTGAPPQPRVLAGPVRRGEILTDARLLDNRGPQPGPGRAAVPVRPHDQGTVALLQPGMRVALIGVSPDGTARTLTDDAIVLSVSTPGDDAAGGSTGRLVLLSVPESIADSVAATAITGSIGVRFA